MTELLRCPRRILLRSHLSPKHLRGPRAAGPRLAVVGRLRRRCWLDVAIISLVKQRLPRLMWSPFNFSPLAPPPLANATRSTGPEPSVELGSEKANWFGLVTFVCAGNELNVFQRRWWKRRNKVQLKSRLYFSRN